MLLMSKLSKVVFAAFMQGVKRHSKYAVRTDNILTHNFLNIQPIFNPKFFWKAETFDPFDIHNI